MRIIKIIVSTIILVVFCFTALFYYKPSSIAIIVKSCIESLLSSETIKVKIDDFIIVKQDNEYLITINKIIVKNQEQDFSVLHNIHITPKIDQFFKTFKIIFDININNIDIVQKDLHLNSNSLIILYSYDLIKLNTILDIKSKFKSHNQEIDSRSTLLQNLDIKCAYHSKTEKKKISDCSIFINDKSSIVIKKASFNGQTLNIDGAIKDIPISFYTIIKNIFPENELIQFIEKNQITGDVVNGEFNIKLDTSFSNKVSNNQITGNFNIRNIFFKYHDSFPALHQLNANLSMDGNIIKIKIDSGYINKTKIDGSFIDIFWNEGKNNKIVIDGYAKGQASDLTTFINTNKLEQLKSSLINLSKITGEAVTKINIVIPLQKEINNTFDISTKIQKVSWNLLKYLNITGGEINASFNGTLVNIESSGLLNNCVYKFKENLNIENNENVIDTNVTLSKKCNTYGLIEFDSGKATLNFNYSSKENESNLELSSDLSKIEFLIKYPTIYKQINEPMKFNAIANYEHDEINSFDIKLTDNKGVNINGKITTKNSNFIYDFPIIKSEQNNFKLLYKDTKNLKDIKVNGSNINLSKMSFDFLTKKNDTTAKSLKIKSTIGNIRMHNNIDINNVRIDVDCDQNTCNAANMNGQLADRNIKLNISQSPDKEVWTLYTNDAGKLFKAINFFDKIEEGDLKINFQTDLKNMNKKGNFILKNFIVTDPPYITKIISLTSFTGFLNSLGSNKKITFAQFVGQFKKTKENLWEIFYTKGEGNYFDFLLNGEVNSEERNVKLNGMVIPHYFIGSLVKPIPIIKDLSLALRTGITKVNLLDMSFTKEFKY